MQDLDNIFFEEYKKADKLCSEMYSRQNGVTEYINDMEFNMIRGRNAIPAWEADYKMLKHLRWVRNQIAHDTGNGQVCNESDINGVRAFRERLLAVQDPLALLHKQLAAQPNTQTASVKAAKKPKNGGSGARRGLIAALIYAAVLAFIFIYAFLNR